MTPSDLVLTPKGVRFLGRTFPCAIGRGGLSARKREGDGATPTGSHRIVGLLYRPDRMAPPTDWALPIGPADLWSDDVKDPDYNTMVRAPHGFGHEVLRRADPLYDLVLLTDWNWPEAIPGRGSAIFLHQWRRPWVSNRRLHCLSPRSSALDCNAVKAGRSGDRALTRRSGWHTLPENRRSNPDMGRAKRNCRFKIAAHSHREPRQARCARRSWPARQNAMPVLLRPAGCTSTRARVNPGPGIQQQMHPPPAGITPAFCSSSPVFTWMKRSGHCPISCASRAIVRASLGRSTE